MEPFFSKCEVLFTNIQNNFNQNWFNKLFYFTYETKSKVFGPRPFHSFSLLVNHYLDIKGDGF